MRTFYPFPVDDLEAFKLRLLSLSDALAHFCYLDSNNYPDYPYSTFGSLFAIDAIAVFTESQQCLEKFQTFQQRQNDWLFGYLNYELKNELESFPATKKTDALQHPLLHFFVPKYLVKIEQGIVEIGVHSKEALQSFASLLASIANATDTASVSSDIPVSIRQRVSKEDYLSTITAIKEHIQQGDIYEMNYCQEFYAESAVVNPVAVFQKLNAISKAPFTSFFKNKDNYLLCASPERFLKRQHNKLISQPIKGTRKRIQDELLDKRIKENLLADEKERSENVMIVDLVRNDFSRIALPDSVRVEELFGVYTFEQVHQMISTVTCLIPQERTFAEIIRATFPMGSMTGAPKIAAMQLIEQYEPVHRGLYSGAVGYITPKGNFDFNVVIRSILYNQQNSYISLQAGSAITIDCIAEQEYEECLLKAKAMLEALE